MAAKMDTIYYGGTVLTMERDTDNHLVTAEAVRVEDGRITQVGSSQELLAGKGADTLLVDLGGKTLLPAFIDPHSHITMLGGVLAMASLGGANSHRQVVERLAAHCKAKPPAPGRWIVGFGYDHNAFAEGCHPTAALLDEVSTDCPVMAVHASGHMGSVNTAALRLLGIDAQTPNPTGGIIGRLEDGSPSGYLEETAFMPAMGKAPKPTLDELVELLVEAQKLYLSYGITTAQDGMTGRGEFALLKKAAESGKLLMDIVAYVDLKSSRQLPAENPDYAAEYRGNLRLGGYKIFLDGSPQGRTAWMSRPYLGGDPDYCGYPIHTDEAVVELAGQAIADGRQLLCHCNGDAASEQFVVCYGRAMEALGRGAELRPVMVHAQTVRADQLDRMGALGMIPSFFVSHTYHWGDVHLQNFGEERAGRISPVRWAIDRGLPYSFHQDTPVTLPDMIHTLWCAANRITKHGRELGPELRTTVEEALYAVTLGAAYQYFEEDEKGSLRPGKRADLVILSQNPLETDPAQLRDIQVLETIRGGVSLYKRA